jgi:aminoglycoside 3-N-acetyltransferase I
MARFTVRKVIPSDIATFRSMLDLFGREFEEVETYSDNQPDDGYISELLASDTFFALVAEEGSEMLGAIAAYQLKKFEQKRSEFYIYDLAVAEAYRRQGVATMLIESLGKIAKEYGAWVTFVQADPSDAPAVALYGKLGIRENVLHFDIKP